MTHDFLDNLEIGFILTESGTEGVIKIVCAEMRQQCVFISDSMGTIPIPALDSGVTYGGNNHSIFLVFNILET